MYQMKRKQRPGLVTRSPSDCRSGYDKQDEDSSRVAEKGLVLLGLSGLPGKQR